MLGSAAANLAVTLGSFGGIFIGGGIVPRLKEWFQTSPFRARFEAKGRFTEYLAQIPTYVIMTPNPALYGVATILSEHLRNRSGANTLITEGKVIPDGSLVMGQPGRVVRELEPGQIEALRASAAHYVQNWKRYRTDLVAVTPAVGREPPQG